MEIQTYGTSTWGTYTTTCDASTGTVLSSKQCTITYAVLVSSFGYSVGQTITVRASAHNTYGWSSTTSASGGSVKTVPADMAAPTTTNTDTTITVTFSTVTSSPANGGLTVSAYSVDYKLSTGSTWTSITGVTSSPQTITGLTAGSTYYVAIRALNSIGYSSDTNYASVTLSSVPSVV